MDGYPTLFRCIIAICQNAYRICRRRVRPSVLQSHVSSLTCERLVEWWTRVPFFEILSVCSVLPEPVPLFGILSVFSVLLRSVPLFGALNAFSVLPYPVLSFETFGASAWHYPRTTLPRIANESRKRCKPSNSEQ